MALPQHIIDQAAHIARVADAIATGRLVGPTESAARNIVSNAATLLAWVQQYNAGPTRVPREPKVRTWREPIKMGREWGVGAEGSARIYLARTKRAALAGLAHVRAEEAAASAEWHRDWAPVVNVGEHGVDWLWEDEA